MGFVKQVNFSVTLCLWTVIAVLALSPDYFDGSLKAWLEINETQPNVTMEAYSELLAALGIGDDEHDVSNNSCYSPSEFLIAYGIIADKNSTTEWFSYEALVKMFPAFIQQQVYQACQSDAGSGNGIKPSEAQSYGFGTLAIFVISVTPFLLVALIPSTKHKSYRYIMNFLMALSASTMLGDAFLHLIPQALSIHNHEGGSHHHHESFSIEDFVWKQTVILGALYAFYLFQMLVSGKHHANAGASGHGHGHSHMPEPTPSDYGSCTVPESQRANPTNNSKISLKDRSPSCPENYCCETVCGDAAVLRKGSAVERVVSFDPEKMPDNSDKELIDDNSQQQSGNEQSQGNFLSELIPDRTLGWMVIVGDAVHNVIDGIAVGAAFSGSLVSGLSTALAIVCHEIPHEVGDFAALLTAGVSYRGALIWNVIHSFLSLGGLFLGVGISADDSARQWVFALTAGMFIYVSLTEMVPELTRVHGEFWKYFAFQNLGLFLGFLVMFIIAIFEEAMIMGMEDLLSS